MTVGLPGAWNRSPMLWHPVFHMRKQSGTHVQPGRHGSVPTRQVGSAAQAGWGGSVRPICLLVSAHFHRTKLAAGVKASIRDWPYMRLPQCRSGPEAV
jgi:hypothetical protein